MNLVTICLAYLSYSWRFCTILNPFIYGAEQVEVTRERGARVEWEMLTFCF